MAEVRATMAVLEPQLREQLEKALAEIKVAESGRGPSGAAS